MVNVLRRWSQPIMVLITVLVIVSFTYFGQNFYGTGSGNKVALTLYGKDITMDALQRQGRRVGVFAALRGEYAQALGQRVAMGMQPDLSDVAQSFVLEHEADALGLSANNDERIAALNQIPYFKDQQGRFDPARFAHFKQNVLNPNGFTDADFDNVFLAGEVRVRKLREIVGSTVKASPAEVRDRIVQERTTTEASFVAFRRADFRKDLQATEEELKKRYEEQKEFFKTPEQRKVRYAVFSIPTPPPDKPVDKKERNTQLEKAANAAYSFRQELEGAKNNFAELASKHGATVGETKDFFSSQNVPQELEGSPEIAEAASTLSKEKPFSSHIVLQKGAYVLELLDIKAPEQRPFEDVKKELETQVIDGKADELARTKATEARTKLAEAVKAGKSFADAAKEAGLKVETAPAFGGMRRTPPGEFSQVVQSTASKLAPGQLSEVVSSPTNDASLIVHVDYRSTVDEKDIQAAWESTESQIENGFPPFMPGIRTFVFENWLTERARAAGLVEKQG